MDAATPIQLSSTNDGAHRSVRDGAEIHRDFGSVGVHSWKKSVQTFAHFPLNARQASVIFFCFIESDILAVPPPEGEGDEGREDPGRDPVWTTCQRYVAIF